MNLKKLVLGLSLCLLIASCTKDDSVSDTSDFNALQAKTSAEMDNLIDETFSIVDNQIEIQLTATGKSIEAPNSILPPCATVTTVVTGQNWTRTIDFGTTGCTMPNGNVLKGIIVISKTVSDIPGSRTFAVSFNQFYFNAKLIQGTKTIVRTVTTVAPIIPTSNMTVNITVTFPNGNTYVRTGNRISQMVEGFGTPIWSDNVFNVVGNWTTTTANWTQSSSIVLPLVFKMNCQYRLVQGQINIVKNNNTATIDYGDGTCDNLATLTINGTTTTFTFGN
jgi:hypothetical protein